MVFATARRITGDAALAEDVAQETFLELARSNGGAVQCVAAWLHRVAWRKACNAVRGESRRRHHEQAAAELLHDTQDATWEEIEPLIDEAMEELPAQMREALVLHYLEGRTQQELAAHLKVSQSTVSRLLDTAIRELRARLRTKGALSVTTLGLLLGARSVEAAPASLTASLGKLAISGAGSGVTGSVFTSTLLAMTTTTKALLATAVVAAIGIPAVIQRSSNANRADHTVHEAARQIGISSSVAKQTTEEKSASVSAARHYRPPPVSRQVRQTVDEIIRRHQGMTKKEMQRSAELNKLMDRFIAVQNTPEMQAKIMERIAALPAPKNGEIGSVKIDFDKLDDPLGRSWLEAAVSGEPQRIEDWMLNSLDGAVFEFGFDPDLEKSSTGVSVLPAATTPAEPEPKTND